MHAYCKVVVGTDGSSTSLTAVDRAAEDRAVAAGAVKVRTGAVDGPPVDVLRAAVAEHGADLLVLGNKGRGTLSGRLLGSVPSDVARRSGVDVLIVHTS